jgi:hypothetical protein
MVKRDVPKSYFGTVGVPWMIMGVRDDLRHMIQPKHLFFCCHMIVGDDHKVHKMAVTFFSFDVGTPQVCRVRLISDTVNR